MIAQKGGHTRGSCKKRHLKTTSREATHLDAKGAAIESACMPGIVDEVTICVTSLPSSRTT
jgi:hypothetical protein